MWWLALASIAAQMMAKSQAEKQQEQDAYGDTKIGIEQQNAASLGGHPYGAEVAKTGLGISRLRRDQGSNNLGLALQAIGTGAGALSSGAGSSAETAGRFGDAASNATGGSAASAAGPVGAAGGVAEGAGDVLGEALRKAQHKDLEDPWKTY